MGEATKLLSQYREAFALGQDLLDALARSLSGAESVDRVVQMLARRRELLAACGSLVGTLEHVDGALLSALRDLVQQQQRLEEAWTAALQRLRQASAQSQQARETLQRVHRLLDTGSRSRLMDQRR